MINGNKIFWDLDGVLRMLSWFFHNEWPNSWNQKNVLGEDLCETIDKNLEVLEECPEAEYIDLARECSPLHIVSAQPDNWRPYTSKWLDKHLPEARVKYLSNTQHKLKYLEGRTRILIEDCPNYPSYRDIILIRRPYNEHVIVEHDVRTPEELRNKINEYLNGGLVWKNS